MVNRAAGRIVSKAGVAISKRLLTGNLETRDCLLVVELKAKSLSVVAQGFNVREFEINPALAVEDLGTVLGVDGGIAVVAVVAVQTGTKASKTDTKVDGGQVGLLRGALCGLGGLRRVLAEAL